MPLPPTKDDHKYGPGNKPPALLKKEAARRKAWHEENEAWRYTPGRFWPPGYGPHKDSDAGSVSGSASGGTASDEAKDTTPKEAEGAGEKEQVMTEKEGPGTSAVAATRGDSVNKQVAGEGFGVRDDGGNGKPAA